MATVAIFDMMGTLVSIEPVTRRLEQVGFQGDGWFQEILKTLMAATLAEQYVPFRQAAELSLTNLAEVTGADLSIPELLEVFKQLPAQEGAMDCLRQMREMGFRLAALTNSSRTGAVELLQRAGFPDWFDMIISTDDVERCKPHPAVYRYALDRLDTEPEEAWMISCHSWDLNSAGIVGIHTAWAMLRDRLWDFPSPPPHCAADSLSGIPSAIAALE